MSNTYFKDYSIIDSIRQKAKNMPFPFISEFKKSKSDKKAQALRFENVAKSYDKKHKYIGFIPYITSANLIIEQLISLANSKENKGVLFYNTSTLVNMLNDYLSNDNNMTVECYKKTLDRLVRDGLIYQDRTRYYNNGNIITYTGLLSGPNPAYKDVAFIDIVNKAFLASSFNEFKELLKDNPYYESSKYKNRFKEGFKNIKDSGLASINTSDVIYEKNGYVYLNFAIKDLIAPFYDALAFAHRNKWEKADILKIGAIYGKRGDNYRNRYIYLNDVLLSKITMITSKNDKEYKEIKKSKKRRLLRLSRTIGIVLYSGLLDKEIDNKKYYALMESKRKFQESFLKNKVNDYVLEEIYRKVMKENNIKAALIVDKSSARDIVFKLYALFLEYKKINPDNYKAFDYACELLAADASENKLDNAKWCIFDIMKEYTEDNLPNVIITKK